MEHFFGIIFAVILGAIFGSYATLFAYRLPLGESCFGRYFGKKSRCPQCENIIRTRELIPLLNWIFTLGRCAKCRTKIPRTHLFVEVATTSLFVICYLQFSFSEQFMIYAMISTACVILLTTDFTHKVFPQQMLIFILLLGVANRVLQDQTIINVIFSGALGIVFAAIFYQIFYKKTEGVFANQDQSFDYTKFIIIASACLQIEMFLLYFLAVMSIFTIILLLDIPSRKNRNHFGYSLIVPFLWLMILPPLF